MSEQPNEQIEQGPPSRYMVEELAYPFPPGSTDKINSFITGELPRDPIADKAYDIEPVERLKMVTKHIDDREDDLKVAERELGRLTVGDFDDYNDPVDPDKADRYIDQETHNTITELIASEREKLAGFRIKAQETLGGE